MSERKQQTSPVKAIREKCLDCCCWQPEEVRLCPSEQCALHPFRFGKNPFIKRKYTPEQRAAMSKRMKEYNKSLKADKADELL